MSRFALAREVGDGFDQNVSASRDIFRRRVFIRTMTVSIAAGDEQHGGRGDLRHEQGVVVSAADHASIDKIIFFASARQGGDHFGGADGWVVRVYGAN